MSRSHSDWADLKSNPQFGYDLVLAFRSRKYPQMPLTSDTSFELLTRPIEIAFTNRTWQSITFEEVQTWQLDIALFHDDAFAYFLPAFLFLAVYREESFIEEFLVSQLSLPSDREALKSFKRRMTNFNKAQRRVIKTFLFAYFDDNPIIYSDAGATRQFWDQLTTSR